MSLKDNRLSDVAVVWLKLLTPWDNYNHFVVAAQNVQGRMADPNEENEYQVFVNPKSFINTSSFSNIS